MGLGVLEPKTPVVQGTIQLLEGITDSTHGSGTRNLKHDKSGKIILAPQPCDDPNDPLNWPRWQRDFQFWIILITTILSLIHGPILAPVTVALAQEYGKSINDIAKLSSYMLLIIGVFAYVGSVLARKYGKRGPFVVAGLFLVASDAWAACATNFNSLLGARMLSGVGQAMFETNSIGIVPDLFFVHERGTRVALLIFAGQTGVTLGTPIATQMATKYGLKWCFAGLAIAQAIMTLAIFFCFYECAYPREHVDALANQNEDEIIAQTSFQTEIKTANEHVESTATAVPPTKRISYRQKLSLYTGSISRYSIFALAWRTVALTAHPTILWVAVVGLPLSWQVGISFTLAQLLIPPPYGFSANATANMFIAAWIGTSLAILIGATNDIFVKFLAKRNNNVYEPEFRLWYSLPGLLLFVLGYVGWGWGAETQISWPALAVFLTFSFIGACIVNMSVIGYILDAHRMYAIESQVVVFAVKNFFAYGLGYFWIDWYFSAGPKIAFGVSAASCVAVSLLTIPFYMYGKKLRAYWMSHPFLGITDMHG